MDKLLIINELKKHYSIKNNAEFARFLGITPQNMYTWVKRNTYDVGTILAKCPDVNAEWLLTGEGEMLKDGVAPVNTPSMERLLSIIESQQRTIENLSLKL